MTETIFMWVVIMLLGSGIHWIMKLLKDIRNTLNKILGQMRGVEL